jgi:hypothetical protein
MQEDTVIEILCTEDFVHQNENVNCVEEKKKFKNF